MNKNHTRNHITLQAHLASEDLDNCTFSINFNVPNTFNCTDEENIRLLQVALHKLLCELDKKIYRAEFTPAKS